MRDLAKFTMLASLKKSRYSGKRTDHTLSEVVSDHVHGQAHAFKVVKDVVPHRFLKPINTAMHEVDKAFKKYTLPWLHDGTGIFSVMVYQDLMDDYNKARRLVDKAVNELVANMDTIRAAAKMESGDAFDPALIPSDEEIRDSFSIRLMVEPMRAKGDFRVDLSDEIIESIKEDYESMVMEQVAEATASAFSRVVKVVSDLADGLDRYGDMPEGAKRPSTFKQNVVNNVRELTEVLDALNIADVPSMTRIASEVRCKLTPYDADTLKEDPLLRKAVSEDARRLLKEAEEERDGIRGFFGI